MNDTNLIRYNRSFAEKPSEGFNILSPEGLKYLPYQLAGVEYSLGVKNCLNADPPGVGKTIQAIGLIKKLQDMYFDGTLNVLIVAPAVVRGVWQHEVEKWLGVVPNVLKNGNGMMRKGINITSYNLVIGRNIYFQAIQENWDLLILDEAHYLKESTSKRCKAVLGKGGILDHSKKCLALSGTIAPNRPIELYPIVKRLCPDAIDQYDYFSFGIRYCAGYKDDMGHWKFDRASNGKELGKKLRSNFMVRRKREKILPQLPEKFKNFIFLDADPEALKLIEQESEAKLEFLTKGKLDNVSYEGLSATRRMLGENKAPKALQYILEKLEGGQDKIIVFFHHKVVGEYLKEKLESMGIDCAFISGKTHPDKRTLEVEKFQNHPACRIFLGSITASGVGITLTASNYVVFAECSWVPGENEQAQDRAYRIGQMRGVIIDFLIYKGSLDESILKSNFIKSKNITEIME